MNEEINEDKEKSPQPSEEETKEENSSKEVPEKETKPEENPQDNTDYKELLEKEKKEKKKWRDEFFKNKEKSDDSEDNDIPEFNPEEIEEKIEQKVNSRISALQKNLQQENAKQWANNLAGSPDEANLILYHYNNTINPSGELEKDMRRAKLLANEGRVDKRISEIMRSVNSKNNRGTSDGSGQKIPPKEEEPELSEEDRKIREKMGSGVRWDPKIKTYVRWDKVQNKWIGPNGEQGTLPDPKVRKN